MTSDEYFSTVKKVHSNYYSYPFPVYRGLQYTIKINCPIHGIFEQKASVHKSGSGCQTCARERSEKAKLKWTTESYRKKVSGIHPTLNFNCTNYEGPKIKVKYNCPLHGDKETLPYSLLQGHGCKNCSSSRSKISRGDWIERFKKQGHKNISYESLPKTFLAEESVLFTCSIHGEFLQTPISHVSGRSCLKCGNEDRAKSARANPTGWSYSNWIKAAEKSKRFDSFKVYIIRCWGGGEEFYKIGKTYQKMKHRFCNGKSGMGYNYEVIKIFTFSCGRKASTFEKSLIKINKEQKYIPLNSFKGMQECFHSIEPYLN